MVEVNNLFHQTYRRGWIIFGYGLAWLGLAFFILAEQSFYSGNSVGAILGATLASAAAGAAGGTAAMWQRLARYVTMGTEFQRQSMARYLLQPLTGLIAGIASLYLVVIPGIWLVHFMASRNFVLTDSFDASTVVAVQILLAGIAGFYQVGGLAKLRQTSAAVKSDASQTQLTPSTPSPVSSVEEAPFAFQEWAEQQQETRWWSLIWGVAILVYGLIWLVGLIISLVESNPLPDGNSPGSSLLSAAWFTIAAGGIGGVVGMWQNLYQSVSIRQDFQRQQVLAFLVQPPLGLIFGGTVYFFMASGYLSLKTISSETDAPSTVEAPSVLTLQLLLGWLAGFRPEWLTYWVRRFLETVIALFRSIKPLLSLRNLWNEARRAETLSEIAQQQAELLRPLDRGKFSSKNKS